MSHLIECFECGGNPEGCELCDNGWFDVEAANAYARTQYENAIDEMYRFEAHWDAHEASTESWIAAHTTPETEEYPW